MAMWSEELRRLTLFDGEAELTPESRLVWQQNMELRTKFVRYPGPRLNGLHPTHFWFLEHYGLLPYFLQMQAEGIPAKVMREAFGIPRDAARDEEQGATWPNQVAVRPRHSPSRGRDKPRHRPRRRRERPKRRCAPPELPGPAAELEVGVVPSPPREVQELSSSSSPKQPPRKEPRVEEPPQQAEGWQEDTALPGFEPSDDELPIGTLRRDISHLRQEVQRTEPLVIREVGGEGPTGRQGSLHTGGQIVSAPKPPRRLQMGAGRQAFNSFRQRAIEQIPLPPSGQKKKKNKTPTVQSVREEIRRPNLRLENNLGPAPPTAGVPQPILVEKTLLDCLAEISRPEAMSRTAGED
ncbi:hypothetical protein R1flu_029297 [Riccia fluitans]|uniref:Uncharacterized protein n=1 Tax=Riccia fluitans TaxID=41844 RepID=A0ABD1XPM9_9MARC